MTDSKKRTNKCKLITKEMSWQEILVEYRKLNDDNDEVMGFAQKLSKMRKPARSKGVKLSVDTPLLRAGFRINSFLCKAEVMTLSLNERMLGTFSMFAENRHNIIQSLPKNLSEQEFKKQLYFRTYGEHLPEDFFDRNNADRK